MLRKPSILLRDTERGADLFPRNYLGCSATCVSQTDSDPTSQFAVAAGNLTTADSDPFGPPVGV